MIHIILLSGGSGTRLWPLSNDSRSKQFLKVLRDENGNPVSMVQRVFSQIQMIPAEVSVTIATCESQKASIESQVCGEYSLVLEPERRDTAPAIMLACSSLFWDQEAAPEDTVIVMPIDTYASQHYYDCTLDIDAAVQSKVADIVLLGVEPTYPSEKYGYIIPENRSGAAWPVSSFKEKPDLVAASEFIECGGLWNCGVFAFRLSYIKHCIDTYYDAHSFSDFIAHYGDLPKNSFDYEVIERSDNIAVVPYSGEWKDLGTWNTLTEEMAEECSGRVVVDDATCSNVHVINETNLPMVVAGLENSVVIATPDGILVSGKEASANIKKQVALAAGARPMYEQRRWGEYRVLDSTTFEDKSKILTKELVIEKEHQISYQRHLRRTEVWTVIYGTGEVVLDGNVQLVFAGSVIMIKEQMMHAIRAFTELHIIEVQLGDELSEEDIERFGNFWE